MKKTSQENATPIISQHFDVLELVGEGNRGNVYRAQSKVDQSPVALKKLHRIFSLDSLGQGFQTQFKRLFALQHPNIIRFFSLEQDDLQQSFFVLEWFQSKSLTELIDERQRPFTVEEALPILAQISEGLAYLHASDFLHLDLKPSNILISKGQVKLTDYNMTQLVSVASDSIDNSSNYWSPEQLSGSQKVSQSSDLYSLSVIAFEMLSGKKYRVGMNGPSSYNDECTMLMDAFFRKACSWEPQLRFQQAREWFTYLKESWESGPDHINTTIRKMPRIRKLILQDSSKTVVQFQQQKEQAPTEDMVMLQRQVESKRPRWLQATPPSSPSLVELSQLSLKARQEIGVYDRIEGWVLLSKKGYPLTIMQNISSGPFEMGANIRDKSAKDFEKPSVFVTCSTFALAEEPMTWLAWRTFLEESGYQPKDPALLHQFEENNFYLHSLRLDEAWAFCDFYGLSLPSEAQWEKAIRCNKHICCAPISEWVADEYDGKWLHKINQPNPCNQGKTISKEYSLRGGNEFQPYRRRKSLATKSSQEVGFRVCIDMDIAGLGHPIKKA